MRHLLFIIGIYGCCIPAHAICKWTDAQGQTHYTQNPPAGISCQNVSIQNQSATTQGNVTPGQPSGLRPGEQALLKQIEQKQQKQRIARQKALKRKRKEEAKQAKLAAKQQEQCATYQRQYEAIREQRRKGYNLSEARSLDNKTAKVKARITQYCQ